MSYCTALGNTVCLAVLGCIWKNCSCEPNHPDNGFSDSVFENQILIVTGGTVCVRMHEEMFYTRPPPTPPLSSL